jgi:hypothetical protein
VSPMNSSSLFKQFGSAVNWNAYYYLVYKSAYTLRTIFLYNVLTTDDFSIWVTINSTVFLILLWTDCGLRKSIPRYAPLFNNYRQWFFAAMICVQLVLLIITAPLIIWLLKFITTQTSLIIIGLGIFIAEGIQNTLRLIYHSYFNNKSFNIMAIICTSLEITFTLFAMILTLSSQQLLIAIFLIKLMSSWLLVIMSSRLTQPQSIGSGVMIGTIPKETLKPFIIHSLIMWGTTVLKSLSERNFLIPFVTQMIGAPAGNLFKVANDSALLGYRLILRTIGSADTALLAHVQEAGNQELMRIAVKKIISKIARLCVPLLGIIILVVLYKLKSLYMTPFVFHAFIIMAIGYIIETTLLPYERVLEVKRDYKIIFICYIPYVCMLTILILGTLITSIGFINMLIFIHGVRLVSCIMMRYAVYHLYSI